MAARVRDLMNRRVVWVPPFTTAREARQVAAAKKIRHLVVLERGDLVGVLCVCDLREEDASVADCMHLPVTVDSSDDAERAAALMRTKGVGCLPVISAGLLVGIVSRGDLDRAGFAERERCAACGYPHNLGRERHAPEVSFCLYCRERTLPDELTDVGDGD